ncbi:MAG: PorT family protein [Bacteroidetes bacterium]|nr:PorT family protein [Bacteroidota bacterium]
MIHNNSIRKFLLINVLILCLVSLANAQAFFKAEVIAGGNLSQVDGDETAGFHKLGFNTGLGVVLPIHKNWSLSFETLYSQKGSRLAKQYPDDPDGSYKLRLNYAEVPLMVMYTDREFMSFGLGASWGRLVQIEEFKNSSRVDSVTLLGGPFSRNDFELLGDVRFRLYKNFKFNLRYSYTLDKIATRNIRDSQSGMMNIRDFYNNCWSLRLIYMLNESPPDKKSKNVLPK